MIIFIKVNLKKIFKKRRVTAGRYLRGVPSVKGTRYGATGMY